METVDKSRLDFVDFYATRIKNSKDNSWRKEQRKLIDSQIENANKFYMRLILTNSGIEKFRRTTGASEKFAREFYEYAKKNS